MSTSFWSTWLSTMDQSPVCWPSLRPYSISASRLGCCSLNCSGSNVTMPDSCKAASSLSVKLCSCWSSDWPRVLLEVHRLLLPLALEPRELFGSDRGSCAVQPGDVVTSVRDEGRAIEGTFQPVDEAHAASRCCNARS